MCRIGELIGLRDMVDRALGRRSIPNYNLVPSIGTLTPDGDIRYVVVNDELLAFLQRAGRKGKLLARKLSDEMQKVLKFNGVTIDRFETIFSPTDK